MEFNKNFFNLKKIKHNRTKDVLESGELYVSQINEFVSQDIFQRYLDIFEKNIGIPKNILSQYLKSKIVGRINFHSNSKSFRRTSLLSTFIEIPKFILFIAVIFFSKKKKSSINEKFKYDLMIDNIETKQDLLRFKKLINLYGENKVIVINPSKNIFSLDNIKIEQKIFLYNYNLKFSDLYLVFKLFLHSIKYSIILSENLITYTISILNSNYYYNSVFNEFIANDCIIFQHYHTNAIKNFLFKKYGGTNSCAIQKNIHQLGFNSSFYDADIFFALSMESAQRPINFGGDFRKVVPCGSLFMEHYYHSNKNHQENFNIDIVIVGGNGFYSQGPFDIYDNQYSDYLTHLEWVNKLSLQKPNLKIVFKSHKNFKLEHSIEKKILTNGNVTVLDPNIDAYQLCRQAKIIYSWASTMIVEMRTLNIPSFFIDPYHRNNQFNQSNELWEMMRISTYEELIETTNKFINFDRNHNHLMTDFCDSSSDTSSIIYNNLRI